MDHETAPGVEWRWSCFGSTFFLSVPLWKCLLGVLCLCSVIALYSVICNVTLTLTISYSKYRLHLIIELPQRMCKRGITPLKYKKWNHITGLPRNRCDKIPWLFHDRITKFHDLLIGIHISWILKCQMRRAYRKISLTNIKMAYRSLMRLCQWNNVIKLGEDEPLWWPYDFGAKHPQTKIDRVPPWLTPEFAIDY